MQFAKRTRHWNGQAYIKHYPNLQFKEYYGIFRIGLYIADKLENEIIPEVFLKKIIKKLKTFIRLC